MDELPRGAGAGLGFYRGVGMPESDLRDVSLVAVTSHEMRAPLAAIRGFVDLLQRRRAELSEAEVEEFLRVISVQTDRLIRLADDLVTMESLEDDTLTVSHEPIVLVPALEQLVRELPGGDRIELRISADAPPTIESDALRLGQVLTNLLTNALKYSDEDRRSSRWRSCRRCGRRVGIAVIDRGIGIEAVERERVFEPFYRTAEGARVGGGVRASASRSRGGSSRRWAANDRRRAHAGGGTTFRVTLPVRAAGALSTCSTVRSSVIGLNGFVKYSSAPIAIARSRPSSPSAVTMITRTLRGRGIGSDRRRAPRRRSIPGCSCRGRRDRAAPRAPSRGPDWPSAASSIANPSPSSTRRIASRIVG